MTLFSLLLAVALALPCPVTPVGYEPEARDAYAARVDTITRAIVFVAAGDVDIAVLLLVVSREESTFDRWIHAGLVHPDPTKHQDHGRARCVLQIHPSKLVPDWDRLAGTDFESTVRCMQAGLRILRSSARYCNVDLHSRDGLERAISLYATGKSCKPISLARERAAVWERYRDRVAEAGKKRGYAHAA